MPRSGTAPSDSSASSSTRRSAHTPKGPVILKNFLYDICGCSGDWKMSDFVSRDR